MFSVQIRAKPVRDLILLMVLQGWDHYSKLLNRWMLEWQGKAEHTPTPT